MKLSRRKLERLAGIAVAVMLMSVSGKDSRAQAPKTIKIVVPFPPGGTADTIARVLGEQVGRAQGRTIPVENRPGAGTVIGTDAAARAAPDGGTLLINGAAFVINPHLRKLNYDPLSSFEPICYLTRVPTLVVVSNASPYRTLADLLDAARAKPSDVTMAGLGPANLPFEMLMRAANVKMTFVPYPGAAPAVNALLGDHVPSAFLNYSDVVQQFSGKLRALATATRTRIETLPDVPTVAESIHKDFEVEVWQGLFAPANTPKETVSQLADWFIAALRVPEVRAKLVALGLFPVGMCGADFGAFIRKQYDELGRVIRESNIKAE